MKKLIFLVLMITSIDVYAECVCLKKVDAGMGWKNYVPSCNCCYGMGDNCGYTQSETQVSGQISQVEGGYNLTLQLLYVDLMIKDENQQWVPLHRNGNNYPFSSVDSIIIVACTEYPSLVNRQIQLSGIVTDSQSNYTVFIPN